MPIAATSTGAAKNKFLTLAEVKDYLRVDHNTEDTLIQSLISASHAHIEATIGRTLINTQYQWKLDQFPFGNTAPFSYPSYRSFLYVPTPPLVSVDSITYIGSSDGASTSWGSTYYIVDTVSQPGRISPAYLETWPTNVRIQNNAVTVTFTAGYGANPENVPEDIRQAGRFMIGHLYENRQDVVVGTGFNVVMPMASDFLLSAHRNYRFEGY